MQNIKSNINAAGRKYAIFTGASSGKGFQTSLLQEMVFVPMPPCTI
jgi:hypothetical protein